MNDGVNDDVNDDVNDGVNDDASVGDLVLVIEDNEQNRYLATYLLERAGYRVVSAPDGPSGIELAVEQVPDVILLDIQLPTMDGYDVARALRSVGSLAQVPIIAVTSYAMVGDREKCLDAGCSGYIEKPIDPETFITRIEQLRIAPDVPPGATP